eukprot:TRINITY_DN2604_c0_g1_i1.p1 TRINITY_DN2604_c0_g1~~TRINITY_DN2604_c0_g1_i1.p1  ORF type:complete len:329 (+),score=111.56 TRINITY_DN2604_c0_g1_i1:1059-2045(+)
MSKTVAVTGASGYVALELVKQLVAKGYHVRCTVRDPSKTERVKPLVDMGPLVTLHKANLLEEGSFDPAFDGVDCVFHTASPFQVFVKDPQVDLIDPALKGTKNVLSSCTKNKVKVVVVTSSMAAVAQSVNPAEDPTKVYSEKDWNTSANLETSPYPRSKYLAERAVWEWQKENSDVRVSTINPSFVVGPIIADSSGMSVSSIKNALNGNDAKNEDGVFALAFGHVDIRNIAQAHIAAFEKEVSGRFPCSSLRSYTTLERHQILRENGFGHYPLATKQNGETPYVLKINRDRAEKELGIEFYELSTSLVDMANSAIALGLVKEIKKEEK